MIRLLLMLATALGVVWLLGRVDTEELRADPVGAIVGQLRIVSPLAPAPKPRGEMVSPPPPFREEPRVEAPAHPAPPAEPVAPVEPVGRESALPFVPEGERDASVSALARPRLRLDSDTTRRIHGRLDRVMGLAVEGGG